MTNYAITITSDTVCPWCYVGMRRLNKAIAAHKEKHPDDTFSTVWLPYLLNPAAPSTSIDKRQYYNSKFGSAQTDAIFARLAKVGEADGINFAFGGRTGATRDSHRLIEMAKETGGEERQTRVVEELFKSYFEQEGDITDHAVLTAAARRAGLEEGQVQEWLAGDAGGEAVDREVREAQRNVITGVPHFVIQDQYEVSGAQEPAAFLQLFERVKTKM